MPDEKARDRIEFRPLDWVLTMLAAIVGWFEGPASGGDPDSEPQAEVRRTAVKRSDAKAYLFLTVLSFAASVTLTRFFLELTGYPQIGNEELHIAHVLWGGLLLAAP